MYIFYFGKQNFICTGGDITDGYMYNNELPVGLTMAFAENAEAFNAFLRLSQNEQQQIITRAYAVQSSAEMKAIIKGLQSK